jgi:putative transposase
MLVQRCSRPRRIPRALIEAKKTPLASQCSRETCRSLYPQYRPKGRFATNRTFELYIVHHKLLISLDGQSVAVELQAALEAVNGAKPRVVHDHGSEFVNCDVAAVIKTHNLIDIKTRPRHPESNGIVERFNGTVRDESDNDYGNNYLQAEAIIAKLMQQYNEERLHATLGYMTPATWHRGQPNEVRDARAGRTAAARAHRRMTNQQRFTEAA